jgi:hypothetical protein
VKRASVIAFVAAISIAATLRAQARSPDSLRLIVATGTTCHTLPDPGSPIAESYHLTLANKLADEAIAAIEEEPPTRRAIDVVRSSLARVASPEKLALLDRLARLDRAVKP